MLLVVYTLLKGTGRPSLPAFLPGLGPDVVPQGPAAGIKTLNSWVIPFDDKISHVVMQVLG
jgi:hypothetical protein